MAKEKFLTSKPLRPSKSHPAKLPITAIIIARDSGATISECVRALGFCRSVIVGENGSRDATARLARAAGATVKTVTWEGYGRTKNALLESVRDGWVLSIDADEIVSPTLAAAIRGAIARPENHQNDDSGDWGRKPPTRIGREAGALSDSARGGHPQKGDARGSLGSVAAADGYWLSRRNFFLGREIKHCGWSPDWQLRLFRAGRGRFNERLVHEALQVEGRLERLDGALDHYSYQNLGDYLSRMNRYTSLAAQERASQGRAFSLTRLLFDPVWTFKKMFVFKGGWRDGFPGFALCALSALNSFVKHAKHWEATR